MKSKYIILRSGISGGTATLSIRIGEWLVNHGYEVLYICQEFNDLNNVQSMRDKGIVVYKWELTDVCRNLTELYSGCSFTILTYSLDEFLFVERLKNGLPIKNSFLYVVSNMGLNIGINRTPLVRKMLRMFYGRLISKLEDNNNIMYPADKVIDMTEDYYDIRIKNREDKVYRLPMHLNSDFDIRIIEEKNKLSDFNMITILRAEFPFKGYIFGLLDEFECLRMKYKNIKLTIIAIGDDVNLIKKHVEGLSEDTKENVELIGGVPYEKLSEYFSKTHLNIGMGTTVLDAANHFVPSILVQEYTYEGLTSGFFHIAPTYTCARHEDQTVPISEYIESVYELKGDAYVQLCLQSFKVIEKMYNIETFMNKFVNTNTIKCDTIVSKSELRIYDFVNSIKDVKNYYAKL